MGLYKRVSPGGARLALGYFPRYSSGARVLGTGMLAVPVVAGSAAYAVGMIATT